ncbi:MAG TPA: PPC domain-containing protein [Polyangia bacterium]|nr:PPC domain-containing protein [Polyangia bacterium]
MRELLVFVVVLGSAACYDPALGPHPFLCGPNGACPDGYTCNVPTNVCIRGSNMPPPGTDGPMLHHDGGGDGGGLGINCSRENNPFDSDLEPNDTPQQADQGQSHLGSQILCHPNSSGPCDPFGSYTRFAICWPGDLDYYGMQLNSGDRLQIQVLFHVVVGDLDAAVVDAQGRVLVESAGGGDNEIFQFTAPSSGRFYLLVEGYQQQTNTYDMTITKM